MMVDGVLRAPHSLPSVSMTQPISLPIILGPYSAAASPAVLASETPQPLPLLPLGQRGHLARQG